MKDRKLRVMSVFGTRPEAIKMCPLVKQMQKCPEIESIVCLTGQHRQDQPEGSIDLPALRAVLGQDPKLLASQGAEIEIHQLALADHLGSTVLIAGTQIQRTHQRRRQQRKDRLLPGQRNPPAPQQVADVPGSQRKQPNMVQGKL